MVQQRNAMHEGPEGRTSWGIAEMEWRPAWEAGNPGEGAGEASAALGLCREAGRAGSLDFLLGTV